MKRAWSTEENIVFETPQITTKFNVSNPPLFPTIPLRHVVIDNLHLFLHVSDVLIDLLVTELRRQYCIDQCRRFSGQFDISKFKHIERFEQYGIPSLDFYIGQTSKQPKCLSLTGPEKLKVFESINIESLLPSFCQEQCSWNLWCELLKLNNLSVCLQ